MTKKAFGRSFRRISQTGSFYKERICEFIAELLVSKTFTPVGAGIAVQCFKNVGCGILIKEDQDFLFVVLNEDEKERLVRMIAASFRPTPDEISAASRSRDRDNPP